jgi:cytochrome P450
MARLPGPRSPLAFARHGLALQRDPGEGALALYRSYGPVVQMGVGRAGFVFAFGHQANEVLMATEVDGMRWREAARSLIPVDGETALVVSDGEDHKRRRRLVQPAFSTRRINGYLELMSAEAERTISAWQPGQVVDAYQALRATVRRAVILALFGDGLRSRADELGDKLQPALDFVNLPLLRQVKVALPGTAWHRAKRARAEVDEMVYAEIRRRRGAGGEGDDVLTWLLAAQSEGDAPLTDEEVRDQVISLIAAGYETTSAAVGWAVYALLADRSRWERLRQDVGEDPLTVEAIQGMHYLDGVVNETLRIWPPGLFGGRWSTRPFSLLGHTVPADRLILYSPYVSHRLPEVWPDPEEFRPERWDREPAPYSYVPFGGGHRRCIGFAFALLEMKAILVELVRTVDLSLLTDDPGRAGLVGMYPKRGVRVEVRARVAAP